MRNISSEGLALLESGSFIPAYLFTLHTSSPLFKTTHHRAISYGAATFTPFNGQAKMPVMESTTEDRKGTRKFVLPNTDGIYDDLIETNGFTNLWVNLSQVFLTPQDEAIAVVDLFSGSTTAVSTSATSVQFSAASYHSIFEEVRGLRTTEVSHQSYVGAPSETNDYTMHWVSKVVDFMVKTQG